MESEHCIRDSRGIKGKTLLGELKYFTNPASSTNIDYMHSVLEGVIKRFFKLWFEDKVDKSVDDNSNYSLKPFISQIDQRLLNLKIPSFIPVCPRSVLDYHIWRANEFLAFFIYYLLPSVNGFMRVKFYVNITKLVVALEYLLNRELRESNLEQVKQILRMFVKEVNEIYPENIMLSGMHELLHLTDCALHFGPMNLSNCFQFEEVNRKILRIIFGKDLVGDEFLNNFSILQGLSNFCENFSNDTKLNEFIEKYKIIKTSNKKRIHENGIKFGPLSDLKDEQFKVLSSINDKLELTNAKICLRLRFNGALYTSENFSRRGDFSILANGNYGLIQFFLIQNNIVSVVVRKISILSSPFFVKEYPTIKSKLVVCCLTDEYFLTTIDKLEKIMFIKISEALSFISSFSMSHLFL